MNSYPQLAVDTASRCVIVNGWFVEAGAVVTSARAWAQK
jgi:hypothetical protein